MLRRLILTLSLVASFGLAQIGAVSHELSHYVEASAEHSQQNHSSNTSPSNQSNHNHSCAKCLGYAELGNAVTSCQFVFTLTSVPSLPTSSWFDSATADNPRAYNARAPPVLA
jgi:hypothetical protein